MSSLIVAGDTSGTVTISAPAVAGTPTLTLPTTSGTIVTSANISSYVPPTMKNRIINGNMAIDQRNAGASVTNGTGDTFPVDRFLITGQNASKFTAQQNAGSVTPPAGFTNYLGCTSSAATSLGASDYYLVRQSVEGLNVADLDWGTANAKTITISFWVRSSLTGTFGGSLFNSAVNRSYPFSYTISAANTWEQKSITIAGDTSGTWLKTNGVGIYINWSLGTGSTLSGTAGSWSSTAYVSATGATSVVGVSGATFYITGVQLEVGSSATSFEWRPYGNELALCQRYYQKFSGGLNGGPYQQYGMLSWEGAGAAWGVIPLKTTMRTQPTTASSGPFTISYGTQGTFINDTNQTGADLGVFGFSNGSGGAAGYSSYVRSTNSNSAYISFSAEL